MALGGLPIADLGQTQGMAVPATTEALESHRRLLAKSRGDTVMQIMPSSTSQQPQDVTQVDPVDLAVWQGEQEVQQLAVFDRQLAQLKAPIQHALDTSYKQYEVDVAAIRNGGLDQDQQRQRIGQLNAQYNKQWIKLKGKMEPQVQALTQAKASAQQEMRLKQALRLKEVQTYAALSEQGMINDAAAKSLQFRALGYDIPVTAFRPAKYQSPYEVVQRNRQIMTSMNGLLAQYKVEPEKKGLFVRDRPKQLKILRPRTEWTGVGRSGQPTPSEKDYVDATPEQIDQYNWALDAQDRLRAESRAAAEQLIGRRVADLSSAVGPLAHGVRGAKSKQQAGRKLTDVQADAILDEAGGNPQLARELARARGYSF